jgi:hypothetical protein
METLETDYLETEQATEIYHGTLFYFLVHLLAPRTAS